MSETVETVAGQSTKENEDDSVRRSPQVSPPMEMDSFDSMVNSSNNVPNRSQIASLEDCDDIFLHNLNDANFEDLQELRHGGSLDHSVVESQVITSHEPENVDNSGPSESLDFRTENNESPPTTSVSPDDEMQNAFDALTEMSNLEEEVRASETEATKNSLPNSATSSKESGAFFSGDSSGIVKQSSFVKLEDKEDPTAGNIIDETTGHASDGRNEDDSSEATDKLTIEEAATDVDHLDRNFMTHDLRSTPNSIAESSEKSEVLMENVEQPAITIKTELENSPGSLLGTCSNNMNATNALKNLHELITNVTGVEEPNSELPPAVASFILPTASAIETSAPRFIAQKVSANPSMENIGSKLLLLAAAQSSASPSIGPNETIEHLMPSLISNIAAAEVDVVSRSKSTRQLLPKPPPKEKTSQPSSTSIVPMSIKPKADIGNALAAQFVGDSASQSMVKILTRASLAPYKFEPPPAYANFNIPEGGHRCLECGDAFAMKTCLQFHMQRRSIMIETACVPCKQVFMFFNKCAYFGHIRMHRQRNWLANVFRSVSIKPIVWKLMEQWFDDSAFKRFSNPEAFFFYEFGDTKDGFVESKVSGADEEKTAKPEAALSKNPPIFATSTRSPCRCSECGDFLVDALELKRHFMYNLPANQKQFICSACQAVYFSGCSFLAHKRTHRLGNPYVCPECGVVVASSSALSTHLLGHRTRPTVLDSWRCVKCFTFYSSWEALVIHMAAAHCEMHHCCRSCTMAFSTATAFEEHKRAAHKFNAPDSIEYRLLAKCCSCESLGFQGKDALIEHLKQHFANVEPFKVYRCAMCGRLMENKSGLVSHFKNVHHIVVTPASIEEDRIVIPAAAHVEHQQQHGASVMSSVAQTLNSILQPVSVPPAAPKGSGEHQAVSAKYFSCVFCRNLHFRSELGLKLHVKMKHPEKAAAFDKPANQSEAPHPPQQQQKSAPLSSVAMATAPPAPIPLLSCYSCKATFGTVDARVEDGLRHLRAGQTVCLLCQNLPMNSLPMLFRHFAKHIDEQERGGKLRDGVVFVCNRHCKLEFTDRAKALNHLRTIHNQKALLCDTCGKEFVDASEYGQHLATAHVDASGEGAEKKTASSMAAALVGIKRAASEVSKVAATMAKKSCMERSASDGTAAASDELKFLCKKCVSKFNSREKMHRHAIECHKEAKFYACLECAYNFASPTSLRHHLITCHQISDVEQYLNEFPAAKPQKANELECDVCHREFPSKATLAMHVRTHGLLFLKTQEKQAE